MRIRSIKPEFWRSDDVNAMCIEDRLLFIGLWSYVDDNGVGIDRQADITADLFAHDLSVSPHGALTRVSEGLTRLHELGVIRRYTVENKRYLEIVNWQKHQRINRPSPGRFPTSDDVNADIHDLLSEGSVSMHEDSLPGAGEQGSRGTGEQVKTCSPAAPSSDPDRPPASTYPDDFEAFWQAYPRKAGKRKALSAWRRARKRATDEELAAGAARYRDDPNREDRYTKHPETWLNGDCWTDDPLPGRNSSTVTSKVDGWLDLSGQLAELENPFTQGEITP